MARVSLRTAMTENQLRRDRTNNVSGWKYVSPEPRGTRVKSILRRGDTLFLFKQPEPDSPLEIPVEVFNSILAHELEIDHVQYFPATYEGKVGVVCERFLRSSPLVDELMEMKELLYRFSVQKLSQHEFKELRGRDPQAAVEQEITNIFMVLEEESSRSPAILKPFFKMIGFDALIGHTDRHWENYGIRLAYTKNQSVVLNFAPLYDTVTSYLVGSATDEELEPMLKRELKDPKWYQPRQANNCKIKVPGNPKTNHFDLMRYIVKSPDLKPYINDLFWAFERFDRKLVVLIFNRYFPNLSEIRKKAIIEILYQRHKLGVEIQSEV